tara:strand:+ start:12294 stop:12854 length:561 start_codon:yes stop_codon:yes gene_type:complete
MDYANHLKEIEKSLSVTPDFLSQEECDKLIQFIEDNKLNDRSTFMPNLGLKGDVGNYEAIGITPSNYPDIYNEVFKNKLRNGFEPYEIQINKYEEGHFIPPHTDKGINLYTVCVPLQTDSKNNVVFGDPDAFYDGISVEESDKNGMTISFPDVKGCGYQFNGTKPIHWVPPTNSLRYSAIILYGLT